MLLLIKIILIVLLGLISVNFVLYIARVEREAVIEIEQDFELRYPRVYLFICIVFFMLVLVLVLNMVVWRQVDPLRLVLTIALGVLGVPFLLLSLVWRIEVLTDHIVYRNMFGISRRIGYDDISRAVLSSRTLTLYTAGKTYRFTSGVMYREYFLKKLQMNGVTIDRYE